MNQHEDLDVIIIGSGFAGLLIAYSLKRDTNKRFAVLEKAASLGGTWRDNRFPGAACDVPSALYSYSFAPNPDWSHKFSRQAEILGYLDDFADRKALKSSIRFGADVTALTWNDTTRRWRVDLCDGRTLAARHVVSAIGQLHIPNSPTLPGADSFEGESFHTARWPENTHTEGKNVAVIGTAATAVQVIPQLVKSARRVTVYHRSPNWIINKPDRARSRYTQALQARVPFTQKLERLYVWLQAEYLFWPTIRGNRLTSAIMKGQTRRLLRQAFPDDREMRRSLTPTYPIGAKRILMSSDFYKALAKDNAEVIFDPVERFHSRGLTAGGLARDHDVVVFATGFQTNPFLKDIDVRGREGRRLRDHWSDGATAYLGASTSGFPNLHMLYGPNTNTGHTSIVLKLEVQVRYVMQLIASAGEDALDVKCEAEREFNVEVQSRLRDSAFSKIDTSWYKDGDRVTNNWMGGFTEFRRRLRTVDTTKFERLL